MKKLFSLLFVALLAVSAWADTVVTVDFNAQGWDTNTLVTDLKVDGVNLTFDKGEGSTKPTYYTNTSGGAVRLYGGNNGTWEGYATEVAFNVNKQCRFTTIIVTVAGQEEPEYELGDVNHDHAVNIADVTALIDYLLNDASLAPAEANVNGDENVNISDVTTLIDMLLQQ